MADAKAKVPIALPKSGEPSPTTPSPVSHEVALKNAIGLRIRITTSTGTQEGILFTADPLTSLLALQTSTLPPSSSTPDFPSGSYKILPISSVTSFSVLPTPSQAPLPIAPLDTAALQSRHSSNVQKVRDALLRKGPSGTTPLAQALFDGLARSFGSQVRWQGTQMMVSDSMVIDRPYGEKEVRLIEGAKGRVGELERIRKVVGMEREKARLKGLKDGMSGVDRKGG